MQDERSNHHVGSWARLVILSVSEANDAFFAKRVCEQIYQLHISGLKK